MLSFGLVYMLFNMMYVVSSEQVLYEGLDWKDWKSLPMVLGPMVVSILFQIEFLHLQKTCKFIKKSVTDVKVVLD